MKITDQKRLDFLKLHGYDLVRIVNIKNGVFEWTILEGEKIIGKNTSIRMAIDEAIEKFKRE